MTIFQELLDKKADVMITDASEALYQQKLKPGLCAVNPTQFMQYGEKAYLLPRDDISWKLYVDQWLHLAKVTGNYQKNSGSVDSGARGEIVRCYPFHVAAGEACVRLRSSRKVRTRVTSGKSRNGGSISAVASFLSRAASPSCIH